MAAAALALPRPARSLARAGIAQTTTAEVCLPCWLDSLMTLSTGDSTERLDSFGACIPLDVVQLLGSRSAVLFPATQLLLSLQQARMNQLDLSGVLSMPSKLLPVIEPDRSTL